VATRHGDTQVPPLGCGLMQRCAGIEKGAAKTVHETVGTVHVKHIYEIAKVSLCWGNSRHLVL
jgi:ribosomal protein L11